MSNERSPRASCWTTTGTSGMAITSFPQPYGCTFRRMLAYAQPISCRKAKPMPVVNREVVLPVPRDRAWELVTEPAELETWLADEVDFEPEEGAPVRTAEAGEVREGVVEHVA